MTSAATQLDRATEHGITVTDDRASRSVTLFKMKRLSTEFLLFRTQYADGRKVYWEVTSNRGKTHNRCFLRRGEAMRYVNNKIIEGV